MSARKLAAEIVDRPPGGTGSPLPCVTARTDEICDSFESAWKSGRRPQIEAYLAKVDPHERPSLLRELLLLELEYRDRGGERPANGARRPFEPGRANGCGDSTPRGAGLLGTVWPFSELPGSVVRSLLAAMREKEFAAGEELICQGTPSRHLIVVVDGTAEVRVADQTRSHAVAKVGRATVLGEMGLLSGEPCTATVIAETPLRAMVLSAEEFHRLAQRHRALWLALSHLVAKRLGRRPVDSLTGKVVGGYRVRRCIGWGGMAVVYEAEHLASGRAADDVRQVLVRELDPQPNPLGRRFSVLLDQLQQQMDEPLAIGPKQQVFQPPLDPPPP